MWVPLASSTALNLAGAAIALALQRVCSPLKSRAVTHGVCSALLQQFIEHLLCTRCFLRCWECKDKWLDSEDSKFSLFIQQNLAVSKSIPVPVTVKRRKHGLFKWKRAWEFSALNLEFEMRCFNKPSSLTPMPWKWITIRICAYVCMLSQESLVRSRTRLYVLVFVF